MSVRGEQRTAGGDSGPDAPPGELAAATAPTAVRLRDLLERQALAIERYRAAVARELGLGDTEMAAVVTLVQGSDMTAGELKARLSLSSGGTTALIHRLERAGHVERLRNPRDGRSVVVRATPALRERVARHSGPLVALVDQAAARLSESERAVVGAWLTAVVRATEREAAGIEGAAEGLGTERAGLPSAWF